MASGDLSNHVPIIPVGGFVKDSLIAGMPGRPLPDSQQQRHWIPDERDNFISWLRGEFAAANAIIDTLCHHLQVVGKPNEYDLVLNCIQQRRYNWTVVLHMQQYFSVAEVVLALQQVVWQRQVVNSDPSAMPPLFVSPVNGGGPPWKDGPIIYRDPRGESLLPGAPHHGSVLDEHHLRKKESAESSRKSEGQGERKKKESGVQERQQQSNVYSSPVSSSYLESNNQGGAAEPPAAEASTAVGDSSSAEMSSLPTPTPSSSQKTPEARVERILDHGSDERADRGEGFLLKPEGPLVRSSTPYLQLSIKEEDQRLATINVERSFSCMEQIEGKLVNTVDGLELYESVLDKAESNLLASFIQDIRTAGKRGEFAGSGYSGIRKGSKGKTREQLQFGHSPYQFAEDHKRRSFPKDDAVPPVPDFLDAVVDRLVRWHVMPATKRPDCCSINIMEEGDYLPPPLDNSHLERPYCTLTLQSDCPLIFGHSLISGGPGDFRGPIQLSLPVGSVLVLHRNSADTAKHGVPASPSKRILITLGKFLSTRPSKGHSSTQIPSGVAQSPPRPSSLPTSSSWAPSVNHAANRHASSHTSNQQPNATGRAGGGGGYTAQYKSLKYTAVSSSAPSSSSGGVLPNPTARPSPPISSANSIPLLSGALGPAAAPGGGGAFPPPSLPVPAWSPLPRPPSRPPTAGTGVFFPSSGTSSGPGRPVTNAPPRRGGNNTPLGPPILQKTNSAPASFASLEAAAIAAAAATTPSTPPGKSSKSSPTTAGSFERGVPASAARRLLSPGPAASAPDSTPGSTTEKAMDPESEVNAGKSGAIMDDNSASVRSSGRPSKSGAAGNASLMTKAAPVEELDREKN